MIAGQVANKVAVLLEEKHEHTTLTVLLIENPTTGRKSYRFNVCGAHQGQGYVETWASLNRYRTTNAGRNCQRRMDSKIDGMLYRRRSFR